MDVNDIMHRKCAWRIWGILKKSVELRTRHQTRRVDFRGSLRPDELVRYGRCTWWEANGKVIIERLCISLPYVETFNSKVIKGFVPELRSRYVFFVFRDSYVLCIYVMNILCTFRISVYGYVTLVIRYYGCLWARFLLFTELVSSVDQKVSFLLFG